MTSKYLYNFLNVQVVKTCASDIVKAEANNIYQNLKKENK